MWSFFIRRFRFSALLIFGIVLMGLLATLTLPKEATPEVKVPYASVTTFYAGASPLDVEALVTDVLEEAVLNVDEVKKVESSSAESFSSIFVEFEAEADIAERMRALQDAVSAVESQLPEGVEDPMVMELNFSNMPILVISLSAESSHRQLKSMAETVRDEIMEVNGVSQVDVVGSRAEELLVKVDPAKLQQYGISVMELMQVLQNADVSMPLGVVEMGNSNYSLRLSADLVMEDVASLILRYKDGVPIEVQDVAELTLDLDEASQYSRVSLEGEAAQDSISLNVYKRTGGDVIKIVDEINERLEGLKDDELQNATLFVSTDNAQDIRDQLGDLSVSGLQTLFFVFLILFLALGFREAFVAGLAIPLTFLIAFTGLNVLGYSLNFLSLFSLILALGILVDTGVVITEGMHAGIATGKSPEEVALSTVKEYKWPLIAGTLTTVAAFAPMLLMTGLIGEFVKSIPVTVSLTLLASLFVGLALLPALGARLLKHTLEPKQSWFERGINKVKGAYKSVLAWFLTLRRRQNRWIAGMLLLFVLSLILPISGVMQVTMFPQTDYRFFFIEVELPKGTQLEETDLVVKKIEEELLELSEISSYVVTVGGSANTADGVGAMGLSSSNLANFTVNLNEDRERSSIEIIDELREKFPETEDKKVNVIGVSDGPPSASAIEFRITGSDLDLLQDYADEAVALLAETEGAVNIASSLDDSISEFILKVDRQRVASFGMNPLSLAQVARLSVQGMSVQTVKMGDEDIDVVLELDKEEGLGAAMSLPIATPLGFYPLSYFVDLAIEPAPTTIQHRDGERSVTISGDVEGDTVAAEVLAAFQEDFDVELADSYSIDYGGELEEMMDSFRSLGQAMILGVLAILVILVLQFNSFRQSFIILMTIPLALIGVFTGLSILQLPFSFPAFIGVVALSGIVVNNAIILVDRINKNREAGMDKSSAIVEAAALRLQPILLTSITTIIGILPLALSDPTWGPLGFTIISGLAFSTLLTLVLIPILYERVSA